MVSIWLYRHRKMSNFLESSPDLSQGQFLMSLTMLILTIFVCLLVFPTLFADKPIIQV
jgi:ABC-type multidrug transport system permease subunit